MARIISSNRLSNTTYHQRCRSEGQRYWWLRAESTGEFVRVPRIRGDYKFEADLDLAPGRYILGTGPAGNFGRRETIIVEN